MILYDETASKEIDNITVLLEKSEVIQLISYLNDLLHCSTMDEHYHLNNDDYSKEVTIALYEKNGNLDHFAEKYRKLIIGV